jgi:hypothetical protein
MCSIAYPQGDLTALHIGTDRQLFVDGFWIDEARGVDRRLHHPVRREVAIPSDRPWEGGGVYYSLVTRDEGRYRMWYRCDPRGKDEAATDFESLTAYAESDDGVHWDKPDLGLIEFGGSRRNNLIWSEPGINFGAFKDENPAAPDDERYKAVVLTGIQTSMAKDRLLALKSADGIRWSLMSEEPIMADPPFDTLSIPMWDKWRNEYVIYTRGIAGTGGSFSGGYRWIRRTTSPDFRSWTPLESTTASSTPFEHLYTNSCVRYERAPGTYLMFPSRFVPDRTPDPEWGLNGVSDIVFMSSRDGLNFDRSFMEAFVRPGQDKENWHERGIYMETGILQTSPEEMSMYGMEHKQEPDCHIVRYTLRTDGFVSVNAGYAGGEFTTPPLTFDGDELELNYSTSAVGSVQVEIQDTEGRALAGYGLADCPEKFGDEIEGVMGWNAGSGVGDLDGQPIRLRFVLRDADLYAFRFRNR